MTKLGLLFVVIFCIIQCTFAARLRRDVIEDGVASIKQTISDTFTKENVDNFFNKLGEIGTMIKTSTGDIGDTIAKKFNEATSS